MIASAALLLGAAVSPEAKDLGATIDGMADRLNATFRAMGVTPRVILGECGMQVRATCQYTVNQFLSFSTAGATPKAPTEAMTIIFGGPHLPESAAEELLVFLAGMLRHFAPASDQRERTTLIATLFNDAQVRGRQHWHTLGHIQIMATAPPQMGLWLHVRPRP